MNNWGTHREVEKLKRLTKQQQRESAIDRGLSVLRGMAELAEDLNKTTGDTPTRRRLLLMQGEIVGMVNILKDHQ